MTEEKDTRGQRSGTILLIIGGILCVGACSWGLFFFRLTDELSGIDSVNAQEVFLHWILPFAPGILLLFLGLQIRGHRMKWIATLLLVTVAAVSIFAYAIWAITIASIPELQDFPGLQQGLENLEDTSDFRSVYFSGEKGNRITLSGYVSEDATSSNGRSFYCSQLIDTVKAYVSEEYKLSVKISLHADREALRDLMGMHSVGISAEKPCPES